MEVGLDAPPLILCKGNPHPIVPIVGNIVTITYRYDLSIGATTQFIELLPFNTTYISCYGKPS